MNSLQLGQRMVRNLTVRDLGSIEAVERTRLIDAANAALSDYWMALAPSLRSDPVTALLRGPVTAQVNANYGSPAYTYVLPVPPAGSDLEGASVLVGDDACLNRIAVVRKFWRPFIGTTGAPTMTVYADCVTFARSQTLKVLQSPKWSDNTMANPIRLTELAPDHHMRRWAEGDFLTSQSGLGLEVGRPAFWWVEPCQPASIGNPVWAVRIWPLPANDGVLQFTVSAPSPVLTFADLMVDRELPVAEDYASAVYAIAIAGMISSPLWAPEVDKATAIADAQRAQTRLLNLSSPQSSEPTHAGTPYNW